MKERPIIFSDSMVQATLNNRKNMTRRVIKPQPKMNFVGQLLAYLGYPASRGWMWAGFGDPEDPAFYKCPYGQPGDRLYVREAFTYGTGPVWDETKPTLSNSIILYRATWDGPDLRGCWKPSIHMPKWATRIWLEITDIRVERVQEIEEEDAIDEGIEEPLIIGPDQDGRTYESHIDAFMNLWNSINGKRPGCAWDDNPWVWVVEFKRTE